MSLRDHRNLTNTIVAAVACRYLRGVLSVRLATTVRLAAWNMDMFARLSILEGAAGLPPGTWLAKKERGFGDALAHFGPGLAASWTAPTDQGVFDKAVKVADRMLSDTSGMDGDELVQEMVVGSTAAGAPRRSRLFYSVGEALKRYENDLGKGVVTPNHARVKGTIDHWVRRAARDVIRSWGEKKTQPFSALPGESESYGELRSRGTEGLSSDQRDNLVLLALQSPGGPGNDIRRTIDNLVERAFTPTERAVVRMFLEKIADPKYRSPEQMKQLVNKFDPDKWFTQAFNLVRRDILEETKMSPQQLTNILGGNAAKVFKFMHTVVGKDPKVQSIITQLADEIELLEPGVGQRVGRKSERKAELPETHTPRSPHSVLRDWYEKDQFSEWGDQATPHTQFSKGPMPARVASMWLRARSAA
jgi:hypothetical protein